MTKRLSTLVFLLSGFCFTACSQTTEEKFLDFLNNYQKDSLQEILSEDFHLKRTYMSASHDKSSFLTTYLTNSKAVNGKYKIIKTLSRNKPKQFLVEDQSNFLKYLGLDYPTWKMTITTEGSKINNLLIDTTGTSHKYFEDLKIADEIFMNWLKNKYPRETRDDLYNKEGLMIKRLQEYVKEKK